MQSFRKFLNKKIVSVFIIFLIALFGGLFFWWQSNKEIKGSPDDYVIKETKEGIFVEKKKAGLIVKAPEDWDVKKLEIGEGAVDFYSSNLEINQKEGEIILPLEKGCKIQASVGYEKSNFVEIKTELRYSFALRGMKSVDFEEIIVDNYPSLKSTFDIKEEGSGIGMSVSIPTNNKVYGFSVMWGFDEEERCIQEFDEFLETISIQ